MFRSRRPEATGAGKPEERDFDVGAVATTPLPVRVAWLSRGGSPHETQFDTRACYWDTLAGHLSPLLGQPFGGGAGFVDVRIGHGADDLSPTHTFTWERHCGVRAARARTSRERLSVSIPPEH
jgi:hypothetical protein